MSVNNVSQKSYALIKQNLTREHAEQKGYNLSIFDNIDKLDGKQTGILSAEDIELHNQNINNAAKKTFEALDGYTDESEMQYAVDTILAQTPETISEFILAYCKEENKDNKDSYSTFLSIMKQINTEYGWDKDTKIKVLNHIKDTMMKRAIMSENVGNFTLWNLNRADARPNLMTRLFEFGTYSIDIYLKAAAQESLFNWKDDWSPEPTPHREMYLDSDGIQRYLDDDSEVPKW